MTAPRWQDVPEEARESVRMWLGSMRRAQADVRDDARFTSHARQTADDDVRAIDAALARLAEPVRSAEGATAAEQLMREVCEALGWQGGTRDGALAAIRQAKRAADAAEAYDRELNETGGAGPAALIRESAAWRRVR